MIKDFAFITFVQSMHGNLSSTQKKNSRLHHEIKIMKITCVEEIIDSLQCFSLFLKIICVFFFAGGGGGNEISSVKVLLYLQLVFLGGRGFFQLFKVYCLLSLSHTPTPPLMH